MIISALYRSSESKPYSESLRGLNASIVCNNHRHIISYYMPMIITVEKFADALHVDHILNQDLYEG